MPSIPLDENPEKWACRFFLPIFAVGEDRGWEGAGGLRPSERMAEVEVRPGQS